MSNYEAGGGDAQFRILRKNHGTRHQPDSYIRRLVEQRGARALAGQRSAEASKMSDAEAFKNGGGQAAINELKGKQQYRYQSESYLRNIVIQAGRRAVRQGPATGLSKLPERKPETTGKEKQGPPQSDTYKVSGITYNRATGRPVKVDKGYEPVKAKDNRGNNGGGESGGGGGGPAPAPEKSARQKEIESIRADKSLSDIDKFVKANRKMIESVGTKRQREMLADYNRRHSGGDKKPDANKVKKSNFGTKTGVDTKKYEVKNKERYDTSKVGGKFKKDLGVETGKYRVKSENPKRRDTSKVKGSNFGRDTGVDTKKYDLPNKDANKDKLRFTTSKLKGIDTKDYEVKKKPNFADKLKKVTGKFKR